MSNSNLIQVFEYDYLPYSETGFTKSHWDTIGWYNENHGGRFFSLTPKGIKFSNYVGVIQVGNLTIEILPKIGRLVGKEDKAKWQRVLIDMLRECKWMQVYKQEKASLRFKPNSILEAYLELFIQECYKILRQGLVKKYRTISSNCTALKGKLIFAKQIQVNLVHQESFYTRHQVFDRENVYNQILLKALKLIPYLSQSPYLKDKVFDLINTFPELGDINVNYETFEKLIFDRKSSRYKEAIEIAAMLLLNYRPDISKGQNQILSILFDMNELWEEYVYRQINKRKPRSWIVTAQNSKHFWKLRDANWYKTIRPDIYIRDVINNSSVVIDTKWKIPDNNIPSDADLKQMYVYNKYWNSRRVILLYPSANYSEAPIYYEGLFTENEGSVQSNICSVMKISVLNKLNTKLETSVGDRINDFLEKSVLK